MRSGRSKTTLFLMELIVAIGVFSLCAAVCLSLFASAAQMTAESEALNGAALSAQSAAECFKAEAGDLSRCAALLGAETDAAGTALRLYYDEQWRPADASAAVYVLTLSAVPPHGEAAQPVRTATVSVTERGGEQPLMTITASAFTEEAAP